MHAKNGNTYVDQHYIYLSTPEATPFQVTITNGAGNPISGSPFTISQGNPKTVFVGNGQPTVMFLDETNVNSIQSDKGLILSANKEFYASFRVSADSHAEILVSKGKTALGKSFRLGSLPQQHTGGIRNFMASFMATEDNTTINLSDYDVNVEFVSASGNITLNTQNFVLNTGQSVVVSGYTDVPANLSGFVGALVTSDKPIAVNTGNCLAGLEDSTIGQDFNLDQIVPVEQVGKKYILVRGNGSNNSEFPLVIATEDNTNVFVNGNTTPIVNLNAGDYFLIPNINYQGTNNKNIYVESTKPVYMYQILAGSTNDATNGFNFIPPLSCFFQKSVDLIPNINEIGSRTYQSDVIAITTTGSTILINGIPTTALSEVVLGNASWITYKATNLTGNVKIESTGPLAVGVIGASGVAGFGGYYSGFGSEPKDTEITVCTNTIIDLLDKIEGNPEPGGTWTPALSSGTNMFNPNIDAAGTYVYSFNIMCDGATLPVNVSINVTIETGPNPGVNSTQSFCKTDTSLNLTTLLGTGITPGGTWSFNGTPLTDGNFDPATNLSGNYTYTIAASGACEETSATLSITVNESPSLEILTPLQVCDDAVDGDTSGVSFFTLTNKASEIIGSQTGITLKYYTNQNDAINNNNNNITTIRATSNTDIFVRLTNSNGCFVVNTFKLIVNPLPVVLNEVTLKQCDTDTDAITDFNLTESKTIISTDTSLVYSYHTSQIGAQNNTGIIANPSVYTSGNNGVIWARSETINGCYRVTKVNLTVSTTVIASNFVFEIEECDDYISTTNTNVDGIDIFNLTLIEAQIISSFPAGQSYTFSYYETEVDALAETFEINDPINYTNIVANSQIIWVRVDSDLNNDCVGLGPYIKLTVNPLPIIDLGIDFTLCVDPATGEGEQLVDATPSVSGSYSYTWTPTNPDLDALGNESNIFKIKTGGTYSVIVTNNVTSCQNFDSIIASFSSEPNSFTASVTTPIFSSGLTTIECVATGGFGIYEYSLNLIDWQSSPIFTDLPNGTYTAYVRDLQGCGLLEKPNLFAITYPNFFTPNGDGYHDTWNIFGLSDTYEAKIYIFDRYGKLLKQINPNGTGWNGTYNGQLLPATDYWFKIEYTEGGTRKEFKSHFTLKR